MKCEICGKEFEPVKPNQKYCDALCRIKKNKDRLKLAAVEHEQRIREEVIEEVFSLADCENTDCWDCAFADAEQCKLEQLKERKGK